jgi:hypothetical protein
VHFTEDFSSPFPPPTHLPSINRDSIADVATKRRVLVSSRALVARAQDAGTGSKVCASALTPVYTQVICMRSGTAFFQNLKRAFAKVIEVI